MRIGALRQVVPDSLIFYFVIASDGAICEGAGLEHELVRASLRCPQCGREWDPAPAPPAGDAAALEAIPVLPTFRCPSCSTGGEVVAGDEFEIEWIELAEGEANEIEEERECIGPS